MTQQQIEQAIRQTILKYIAADETYVFLYGSRADGTNRLASDYDIGLYSGKKIPWALIAKIDDELDAYPIPVDVEIVDFSLVTENFKRLALKNIQLWNKPKKNLKLT